MDRSLDGPASVDPGSDRGTSSSSGSRTSRRRKLTRAGRSRSQERSASTLLDQGLRGRVNEGDANASAALIKHVEAWVDGRGAVETVPGYDFDLLRPGHVLDGPAIVWTPITTLVVAPGQRAGVDEFRNIVVTLR